MPVNPPATPDEAQVITSLANVATTEAASVGNQASVLNAQLNGAPGSPGLNQAQTLFQTRYQFWYQYITQYFVERSSLDGYLISYPIQTASPEGQDYINFLNGNGRLYNGINDPNYPNPSMILQYSGTDTGITGTTDGSTGVITAVPSTSGLIIGALFMGPGVPAGSTIVSVTASTITISKNTTVPASSTFTTQYISNETAAIAYVNSSQTYLVSGFISLVQPILITSAPITPSSTSVIVDLFIGSVTIGGDIVIHDGTTAALYQITDFDGHTRKLSLELLSLSFVTGTINAGATVSYQTAGFTNTERTTKISSRQDILNLFIAEFLSAVEEWKTTLTDQNTAIEGETEEDAPDTAYIAALNSAITSLTNYIEAPHAPDVSDTGFAFISALVSTRTTAIPARITWIGNRLTSTGAYDSQYKYAGLLFNLNTGITSQMQKLTYQQNSLVTQQSASNARAAAYNAEV